jgi:uncharacterized membrane protein (DUF485 family)
MSADLTTRVLEHPAFRELERRRSRLGWTLTAIILLVYFGFILLVAFSPATLAQPVGGMTMSLGLPVGVGIILVSIAATGIYVRRANSEFDELVRQVRAAVGEERP